MKKHRILSLLLAAIMLIPANVTALAYDRTSKEPPSSTERVEQLRNSGLESLESADPIDPLEEITAIVNDMFSTIPADDSAADEYNEQLGLVNADCQVLLSDDAEELLNEAGCADVNTDWSEQTAGVLGLVMAAAGVEG